MNNACSQIGFLLGAGSRPHRRRLTILGRTLDKAALLDQLQTPGRRSAITGQVVHASLGELRTTRSCSSRILSVVACRLAKSVNLECAVSRPSTYIPSAVQRASCAVFRHQCANGVPKTWRDLSTKAPLSFAIAQAISKREPGSLGRGASNRVMHRETP